LIGPLLPPRPLEMTWKTVLVILLALAIGYGTLALIAFGK
jgi:hypothetical protein